MIRFSKLIKKHNCSGAPLADVLDVMQYWVVQMTFFLNDEDKEKHEQFVKRLQNELAKARGEKPPKDKKEKSTIHVKPNESDMYEIHGQKGKVFDLTSQIEEIERRTEEFRQREPEQRQIKTAKAGQGLNIVNQLETAKASQKMHTPVSAPIPTTPKSKSKPSKPGKPSKPTKPSAQERSQMQRILDIKYAKTPKPKKVSAKNSSKTEPITESIDEIQSGKGQLERLMDIKHEQENTVKKQKRQTKKTAKGG